MECLRDQTVAECEAYQGNGVYSPANDGEFVYNGGHMERHAVLLGLGGMNNTMLSAEIRSQLGSRRRAGVLAASAGGGRLPDPVGLCADPAKDADGPAADRFDARHASRLHESIDLRDSGDRTDSVGGKLALLRSDIG